MNLDIKATPFGIYSKKEQECLKKRLVKLHTQKKLSMTAKTLQDDPIDEKLACLINKKLLAKNMAAAPAAGGGSMTVR